MPTDALNIRRILDFQKLQPLFDDFSAATGFTIGLIDSKTGELLLHTGWRQICLDFHHTNPESKKHCVGFNAPQLPGIEADHIHIHQCKNGFIEGFAPIIIDGHHLATLFTGQTLFAPADKEKFKCQAQKYGFDEQHYLNAVDQVPVVSEQKFRSMLHYLAKTVTLFAETGLSDLQSHQEAAQKESLLQSIFRTTPTGVNLAVDRKIYWVNEKFAELTGYSESELKGQNARLLYLDDESFEEAGRQIYQAVEKFGTGSTDTKWRCKDGKVIDVYLSASKVGLQDFPDSVTFSVLDISARKKIEEELRKSEQEWARTFHSFSDIVTILSLDYRIKKINKAGCEALGLPEAEILDRHCHQLYNDSPLPCPNCPISKTIEKNTSQTHEIEQKKLGKTFLVSSSPVFDSNGEILHIAHVAKDITTFKKLEKDQILLSTAIEQATETVVILDTDGNIQYTNPAFTKNSGYSRSNAIGQNFCFLNNTNHDQQFLNRMWSTLRQGNVWKNRLTSRKKDGSLFEENVTISPIKNQQGEITNFVALKTDISKEVQLEKQLRQRIKMEAIGTLASGIAHDFNNILTAIIGYGQIADMRLHPDDPVRKDLAQVISAGNRAAELVKQILAFSRQSEEAYRPVNLRFLVKEVLTLLRSSLPSTITIKENIENDCGTCLADPTHIHQIVMNLCTNAKHAIGNEIGTLSVSLSEIDITDPEAMADCPLVEPGTYLDLKIEDTGCGMDTVTMSKIFDPFFTTKEKGEGTGLGLSVVHGIIKQCNGEITVTSKLGQGTTFHVYFPVLEAENKDDLPVPEDTLPGTEHILLIDDEELIIYIHQQLLENLGYQVTPASGSMQALEMFKKNPRAYDLIITDMTMPEKNGIDLAKEMLKIRPDIPVFLCSGHNEHIDEEQVTAAGIRKFFLKPANINTLSRSLREAFDSTEDG